MLYKSKLKGSFGRIYPITMILVYILCMIEIFIRWNLNNYGYHLLLIPSVAMTIMGLFFMVTGIIQFYKYRLWVNVVFGFLLGIGCILAIFVFSHTHPFFKVIYIINALLFILLIILGWPVFSGQERFEANARRLFRLASELITETSDGFTERPFSAGNIDVSIEDLEGFARFANGKYIARSFHTNSMIYLIFSMNRSVLTVNEPTEVSYISIDKEGNISVRISQQDYHQYKTTFNFDQLCETMARVFTRFIEYYKDGNESRIITELKSV
ncbi:MAG: hypothetical protein K8S16_16015 [Bacteroidales bacterium]|nr:hypothetical protein [Bacteroidales bacterium]